jgi:VanZ like family
MRLALIVVLLAGLVALVVPRRLRAVAWALVIIAGVAPWTDYQGHAHWAQVGWWPFISPPVRLRDILLNILLYVPLGWHLVRWHRWPVAWVVAAGLGLSCVTEYTQVFSHERFATTTDVVTNGLGTLAGAFAAVRASARSGDRSGGL